ncbi:MAG: TonB-dependent receptor [Betaproteobacteria bacterium]|nr:TonB-dependent receptor [Betaproteobacteria bacterium]
MNYHYRVAEDSMDRFSPQNQVLDAKRWGLVILFFQVLHSQAQNIPAANPERLQQVTVTGNALGNAEGIQAVQVLQGEELLMRSQSTLGETLATTPGVSSSYFGPNASRPIIRGMDGDRIKILNNSASSHDVSALSNDHAVPSDPLTVERIEVLRGPAAIMYGGSAVGGVVNLIDNRIPTLPMEGLSGKADVGWSTVNKESRAAVMLESGNERYGLHVDAFGRHSGDMGVPDTLACTKSGSSASAKAICNSANTNRGYALGGSVFWDKGYLGLSGTHYNSTYGTVAEDTVTIGMQSDRYALETEIRHPLSGWDNMRVQFTNTDYQHTEYESGEVGTLFSQEGQELRWSAKHQAVASAWGQWQGVVGWQAEDGRFAANGAEAFMPSTQTRQSAIYFSFGLRSEAVKVNGNAFDPEDDGSTRYSAATSNTFSPISSSLGVLYKLSSDVSLKAHWARTARAPKDYELRADGVHVATAAYEQGSVALQTEKARQMDIGMAWGQGPHTASLNYFDNRFSNYIGLNATGDVVNGDGVVGGAGADTVACTSADADNDCWDKYAFSAVRAQFKGWEAMAQLRLTGSSGLFPAIDGLALWDLKLRADSVLASNLDTGEALPRIAPLRWGAALSRQSGPWRVAVGLDKVQAPRLASTQVATAGYTLWNTQLSYRQTIQANQAVWYLRVDNLTDQLAYPATSVLTTTAADTVTGRPKAPLPGRNIKLGLQLYF